VSKQRAYQGRRDLFPGVSGVPRALLEAAETPHVQSLRGRATPELFSEG
jgi:hypothetical protein